MQSMIDRITGRLREVSAQAQAEFNTNQGRHGIGFCAIDGLLPEGEARAIHAAFAPANPSWRLMDTFRERKLTSKQFDSFAPILKEITFALQAPEVVPLIEGITGVQGQLPDPKLYAGGLSMMRQGDFLDPHIDNSHDQFQQVYRRLNLLYYVSPGWTLEKGGNLELWDKRVRSPQTIVSAFNRLVLMETHSLSWHSVSEITAAGENRCCVSNYYFSKASPTGSDYYHVTSFMARPGRPFRRSLCRIDNTFRSFARVIRKGGFGKVDVYQGKPG